VHFNPCGGFSTGLAGLAIMYGLNLNGNLSKLVWNLSSLETTVICVERIRQYCTLKTEAALIINNSRPSKAWPSEGNIAIYNLQV
jgi:ATP-binding cassette subfamily C (CFTR/MRP) protein 2